MEKDLIYTFDKITKIRSVLGEVQSNFNMSFTIDGTKDSCSIVMINYSDIEIEPYTILWHKATNTWWVVSHDRIVRSKNEEDFVYTHELELLGAVELLNARDLTDCAFNDNKYTVRQFIERLFKLSNFEYDIYFSSDISQNFLAKKVDFIKTFENYTLLSALREFLDAFNMSLKLSFDTTTVGQNVLLYYARIHVIPKTGNKGKYHLIEDFDDVREIRTIDKNSFGTTVVSNAENIISSVPKTFPTTGGAKISGTEYLIKPTNAVIRLPSKVFKANWLKMVFSRAPIDFEVEGDIWTATPGAEDYCINSLDDTSMEKELRKLIEWVNQNIGGEFAERFEQAFNESKQGIIENVKLASSITLYDGNVFDPVSGDIKQGDGVPYITSVQYMSKTTTPEKYLIFCDKEMRNNLKIPYQAIAWERNSNIISGFDCFDADFGMTQEIKIPDNQNDLYKQKGTNNIWSFSYNGMSFTMVYGGVNYYGASATTFHFSGDHNLCAPLFVINYIPMSDLKVKVDNSRDKKDVQMYNQNGKLTDSIALSKLLNSYSKEISSNSITRYMNYYSLDDLPSVGDIVVKGNENYVINNISLDFYQNESSASNNFSYYINAEITMSKYVSLKSLMVNPNTNIRDYGIPQSYNIKRKQLYRDYYELNYTVDSGADSNYYLPITRIFNFTHNADDSLNFIAVMKLNYETEVDGSYTWYYQLETTNYYLNKMIYVVLDFNDNNIIGYGSQNVFSGFVLSRIFSGTTDTLNTPISYTDANGNVKDFDILLLDNLQLTAIYREYLTNHSGTTGYENFVMTGGALYNYSIFIPEDIFIYATTLDEFSYSIRITENNYYKDALEVPVFEYACQIEDSNDVLVGDNIFNQYDGYVYFYSYVKGENLTQDNVVESHHVVATSSPLGWKVDDGAEIEYDETDGTTRLLLRIYGSQSLTLNDNVWVNYSQKSFTVNKDYAIFRHAYNKATGEEKVDLLFIAKKVPISSIINYGTNQDILVIPINHYKLN